jgi:hypothetical protein
LRSPGTEAELTVSSGDPQATTAHNSKNDAVFNSPASLARGSPRTCDGGPNTAKPAARRSVLIRAVARPLRSKSQRPSSVSASNAKPARWYRGRHGFRGDGAPRRNLEQGSDRVRLLEQRAAVEVLLYPPASGTIRKRGALTRALGRALPQSAGTRRKIPAHNVM